VTEVDVAESRKATEKPAEPLAPKLAPAGASGNAEIHNLLGERSVHASNGDAERVADVDRRLAELGYRV
jgi:hypothetical protein